MADVLRGAVRTVMARRWLRRTLGVTVTLAVVAAGLLTVASVGVIVRDDDGCPRSVGPLAAVSWIDVVHVDGITYERVDGRRRGDERVDRALVGDRLETVKCAIAQAVQKPGYDLRDGEATYLEPGTTVHALVGTDVAFRVVAMDDGSPFVYENRWQPDARTGADLLPFDSDAVRAVRFLSDVDGRTLLGEVTARDEVVAFVDDLRSSAVDPKAGRGFGEEPRVFIALELAGQPPVVVVAYPRHAVTTQGLRLSDEVVEQLPEPARSST